MMRTSRSNRWTALASACESTIAPERLRRISFTATTRFLAFGRLEILSAVNLPHVALAYGPQETEPVRYPVQVHRHFLFSPRSGLGTEPSGN